MGIFGRDVHHRHTKTTSYGIPYEKSVTVTEKKAPTDESIKLYKEVLEKAKGEIIETMKINSCGIELSGVAFQENQILGEITWLFAFELNNQRHKIELPFDRYESSKMRNMNNEVYAREITDKLIQRLSDKVAMILLSDTKIVDQFIKISRK
jgi:hypothetical protein